MDKNETFKTSDTVLAATLLSLDFVPTEFTQKEKQTIISFKKTKELDKEINIYWSGGTRVEPTTFHLNFRRLKSLIGSKGNDQI